MIICQICFFRPKPQHPQLATLRLCSVINVDECCSQEELLVERNCLLVDWLRGMLFLRRVVSLNRLQCWRVTEAFISAKFCLHNDGYILGASKCNANKTLKIANEGEYTCFSLFTIFFPSRRACICHWRSAPWSLIIGPGDCECWESFCISSGYCGQRVLQRFHDYDFVQETTRVCWNKRTYPLKNLYKDIGWK